MIRLFPSRTIALEAFGLNMHWYGIMYLLAAILAVVLLPYLQKERNLHLTRDEWISIVTMSFLGVIIGGRSGYVFFYEPQYFASNPLEILAVWKGGMSSHGGFLGVIIAILAMSYTRKISLLRLADVIIVPAAVGLAFGRFGNFINQELYGTVTDLPWAISVPGVEGLRHPTQLYAVFKDLFIALICYLHLRYMRPIRPGQTAALFLILYGLLRFVNEALRDQQYGLIDFGFAQLSRGQLLSLPIFVFGLLLWMFCRTPQVHPRA